jgi:hypothetical protein
VCVCEREKERRESHRRLLDVVVEPSAQVWREVPLDAVWGLEQLAMIDIGHQRRDALHRVSVQDHHVSRLGPVDWLPHTQTRVGRA